MTPDWFLVTILFSFAVAVTSLFWIMYGAMRADDMRLRHADEIEQVHRSYTMQSRTYGSVPVEKLIGREG